VDFWRLEFLWSLEFGVWSLVIRTATATHLWLDFHPRPLDRLRFGKHCAVFWPFDESGIAILGQPSVGRAGRAGDRGRGALRRLYPGQPIDQRGAARPFLLPQRSGGRGRF